MGTYKLINEKELFERLSEGDVKAFNVIFHHFNRRLVPFVMKMTRSEELSEEIIQDVFIQIWSNRAYFKNVQYPTSYVFNIASNKTLDYLRKIANNEKLLLQVANRLTEITHITEETLEFKESAEVIDLAVSKLPPQRQLIYQLSRNEGLSHSQIADRLQLSQNTVKNQLVHALKFIRQFIEQRSYLLAIAILLTHLKK